MDFSAIARKARSDLSYLAIEHDRYRTEEVAHLVTFYDDAQSTARAAQREMFTKYSGSRDRQFSYLKQLIDGLLDDNLTNSRKASLVSKDEDKAARSFVKATYPNITDPASMRTFLTSLSERWPCFQIYLGIADLFLQAYEGTF